MTILVRIVLCFFILIPAKAEEISLLSLNLHGYHPMNASAPLLVDRSGKKRRTFSHLFYFSWDELKRRNTERNEALKKQVLELSPDILLFQEVGAGGPFREKNCQDFYRQYSYDHDEENTVFRLQRNLQKKSKSYKSLLACRGNTGWRTDPGTFQNTKVESTNGKLVHDYGSNPYPKGIVVEGLGILVNSKYQIIDHRKVQLDFNHLNEKYFFQLALLRTPKNKNIIILNTHAGHKVAHAEQAVAVQKYLKNYMDQDHSNINIDGIIVGGDFNARLKRKNNDPDNSMLFWEKYRPGLFDLRLYDRSQDKLAELTRLLYKMNRSKSYKPWANINSPYQERERIDSLVRNYETLYWMTHRDSRFSLKDALSDAIDNGRCIGEIENSYCYKKSTIDFFLISKNFEVVRSKMLFSNHNWFNLKNTISDHPGLLSIIKL